MIELTYPYWLIREIAGFLIFDRLGFQVFEGSVSNQFIWDGTYRQMKLPTGTYWYHVEWTEPSSGQVVKMNHWILLKNK